MLVSFKEGEYGLVKLPSMSSLLLCFTNGKSTGLNGAWVLLFLAVTCLRLTFLSVLELPEVDGFV